MTLNQIGLILLVITYTFINLIIGNIIFFIIIIALIEARKE